MRYLTVVSEGGLVGITNTKNKVYVFETIVDGGYLMMLNSGTLVLKNKDGATAWKSGFTTSCF